MIKILFLGLAFLSLASSCQSTKIPSLYGKVEAIKKTEIVNKDTGQITTQANFNDELAEKSIIDKGADSLLTAQRVVTVGQPFENYSITSDNRIAVSLFNRIKKSKNQVQGSDIWVYSKGKTRVTKTNYFNLAPSFSTNGQKIYFTSKRGKKVWGSYDQDEYIWRVPSTGGGGITRVGYPAYSFVGSIEESLSGNKILYSSKEFSDTAPLIWYSKSDGSLPTQLTQGVTPKWVDEDKIVFMAEDENTNLNTIWTLNIDGGMLTQVIADDKLDCLQPVPSPDGNFIAYVKQNPKSKNPGESRDIYVYNVQSGLTQQLTTNTSRDDMPRWSTSGDKLLFRSTRGVNWNIWQVNTDTLKSM